jgi:virginiamycin B lyase
MPVIFSLALFAQAPSLSFTEYPVPSNSVTAGAGNITRGPDGAMWFLEGTGGSSVPKIGRISASGLVSEFPTHSNTVLAGIAAGPDGALWFTEVGTSVPGSANIGRITTAGVISYFPVPMMTTATSISTPGPSGITAGPDGALWFTERYSNKIGRITTAGALTEYQILSLGNPSSLGDSITAGPDGALWFTMTDPDQGGTPAQIGRITVTGAISRFTVPNTSYYAPSQIVAGPDGALWFTQQFPPQIGRITTAGATTFYPTVFSTVGIAPGPDGALWFTQNPVGAQGGKIGRISTSGAITEYALPSSNVVLSGLATGPDGALWYPEVQGNTSSIGRAAITTTASARAGVLSHIAAGGSWATVITLVNNSLAAVPVTVTFRNDDGSPLSLPVTTTLQGNSQAITTASLTETMGPNATLLISSGPLGSTVAGWADVTSAGSLGGYAIFRQTPQSGPPSEGTVPLQKVFPSTMALSFDNSDGFVTGVALANISPATANITATVWDENGNQLGAQDFPIAANGHASFVLPAQIPLTAGKRGIVQFRSSGALGGLGLRFSPFGTFTSVPPM